MPLSLVRCLRLRSTAPPRPPCPRLLQVTLLGWLGRVALAVPGALIELLRLVGLPPCTLFVPILLVAAWIVLWVLVALAVRLHRQVIKYAILVTVGLFLAGLVYNAVILLLKDDLPRRGAKIEELAAMQREQLTDAAVMQQLEVELPSLHTVVVGFRASCATTAAEVQAVDATVQRRLRSLGRALGYAAAE